MPGYYLVSAEGKSGGWHHRETADPHYAYYLAYVAGVNEVRYIEGETETIILRSELRRRLYGSEKGESK